jgi:uncharacterized protein involved in exopolysaccharide biosynthesis
VDLKDVGQRIFKRHALLILVFLALGLAAPVVVEDIMGNTYTASARVDLGPDVSGTAQSASVGDMGLGLATSPQVVANALKAAKVDRTVVEELPNIQVTPVGSSGVLDVTVTDTDAATSATIANSLATQVVELRNNAQFASSDQLLAQLKGQSAALTQAIDGVVAQEKRYPYIMPGLQAQQADLTGQRSAVDAQVQALSQSLTTAPRPRVIDASAKQGVEQPSNLAVLLPLGGLLGLLVGIAVAATREATSPTLDRDGLARFLRTPVLGRLGRAHGGETTVSPALAGYVGAAADAAGVHTVQVIPVGRRPADVTGLAATIDAALDGVDVVATPLGDQLGLRSRQTDAGVVVVAPGTVKGRHLSALQRHLAITRQPVLGVIGHRGRIRVTAPQQTNVVVDAPQQPVVPEQAAEPALRTTAISAR